MLKLVKSDILSKAVNTDRYSIVPFNKGKSQSFLIKNSDNKTIAIFKPDSSYQEDKTGKYANAGSEFTAYEISRLLNLNVVPAVTILSLPFEENGKTITKIGSLQYWFEDYVSCETLKKQDYSNFLEEDVKKIVFLDYMIGNTDRHAGNLLVKFDEELGKYKVRAIDHGLSMISKYGKLSSVFNSFKFEGDLPSSFIESTLQLLDKIKPLYSFSENFSSIEQGIITKDKSYGVINKRVIDKDNPSDEFMYSTMRYNYNTLVNVKDILFYTTFNDLGNCSLFKYYDKKIQKLNAIWLLKKILFIKKTPTWGNLLSYMI